MKKTRNKLPRDRQIIVDILNFDETPTRWLHWFLGQYEGLDVEKLRDELRRLLFLRDPKGRREFGPLAIAAQDYPIKIIPVASEDNRGIKSWREPPSNPHEHVYQTIIEAVQDGSFYSLQQSCRNCGRYYWHRGDYCNLDCGQTYNSKQAKERMARLRKKRKGK